MNRRGVWKAMLCFLALAMVFQGLCADIARAEVSVSISASVSAEGASVSEGYTLRMAAGDAGCPMPGGASGGSYDLRLSGAGTANFPTMTFSKAGDYAYTISQVAGSHVQATRYDDTVYDLRVQVRDADGTLKIAAIMNRRGSDKKAASADFTNTYAQPTAAATTAVTAEPTATPTTAPRTGGGTSGGGGGGGEPVPTATPTPTVTLTGNKIWADESNAHGVRPKEITLRLYANGEALDIAPTWESKSGNAWRYSFGTLPATDADGRTISYTVREDAVPYYRASVSGMTVTNTLEAREPGGYTTVSGVKTWKGDDQAQRPAYVTVRLLRDGEAVDSRTVTAANDWRYSFDGLPLDDGYGHSYVYAVHEDGVQGYFARYSGYNVTNTKLGDLISTGELAGTEGLGELEGQVVVESRKTGTPLPKIWAMTEEELEEVIDALDRRTPRWGGLLATGDDTPLYPFLFGGLGALALVAVFLLGRRRRARR